MVAFLPHLAHLESRHLENGLGAGTTSVSRNKEVRPCLYLFHLQLCKRNRKVIQGSKDDEMYNEHKFAFSLNDLIKLDHVYKVQLSLVNLAITNSSPYEEDHDFNCDVYVLPSRFGLQAELS
jgi:hypothetical protein